MPKKDEDIVEWTEDNDLPLLEKITFDESMINQDNKGKIKKIKKREIFNSENTISYRVYVVPCIDKMVDVKLCIKQGYLNSVVQKCVSTEDSDNFETTFLIAHDQDFNVDEDCILLSRIDSGSYSYLEKLLRLRHVFLFKHDGRLSGQLNKIPKTDEEALDFDSCRFLHKMADAKARMIQFFNKINNAGSSKYKQYE